MITCTCTKAMPEPLTYRYNLFNPTFMSAEHAEYAAYTYTNVHVQ